MNQNPNRAERPDIPTRPRRLHPQRHVRAVTHGRPKDIHHQRGVHRCNNHPTVRDDPHSPHLSYLRETSVYGRGKHGADVQMATPVTDRRGQQEIKNRAPLCTSQPPSWMKTTATKDHQRKGNSSAQQGPLGAVCKYNWPKGDNTLDVIWTKANGNNRPVCGLNGCLPPGFNQKKED